MNFGEAYMLKMKLRGFPNKAYCVLAESAAYVWSAIVGMLTGNENARKSRQ